MGYPSGERERSVFIRSGFGNIVLPTRISIERPPKCVVGEWKQTNLDKPVSLTASGERAKGKSSGGSEGNGRSEREK